MRTFYTDSTVHAPAMYQVNTGRILMGYPSMGSWVTYGLGSESENLPAYVVMPQPEGTPEGGTPCWGAGFLPAVYQGTVFRPGPNPILNLQPPEGMTPQRQRRTLDFLQKMNEMDTLDGDTEMAARISSYELAFRMQSHAPEAVDLSKENATPRASCTASTRSTPPNSARAACWRGGWWSAACASSSSIPAAARSRCNGTRTKTSSANHEKMCGMTDLPVAGLLTRPEAARTARFHAGDLGRRVRPPADVAGRQRPRPQPARLHDVVRRRRREAGHDRSARPTSWACAASARRYHMRDFHATILHLLGLDQNRLWFLHNGRNEKLTDFGGTVIREMLA